MIITLVNGWFKWKSGASSRERAKNSDLLSQRIKAIEERDAAESRKDEVERERDAADRKRREAEEHVSLLNRQIIELGHVPVERK